MILTYHLIFGGFLLAFLSRTATAFTYKVSSCTSYKAQNSLNAVSKYCTCNIKICPNQYVSIDSCGKCTGTQYLRLFAANGTQVAVSNGATSSCAPCGRIANFHPKFATSCQTYKLREGCSGSGSCSATVKVITANSSIPSNYSSLTVSSVRSASVGALSSLLIGERYSVEEVDDFHFMEFDPEEDGDFNSLPEESSRNYHRNLLGFPSRSPTRRPTSSSASSGYCMSKTKTAASSIVIGIIIPVIFVAFAVGAWAYRKYKYGKVHNDSSMPMNTFNGPNGSSSVMPMGYGPQSGQQQQPMMGSPYGQPGMMMGQQQQPMMGSPYDQPGMMMGQQQQQQPMMGSPYGQPGMMMNQQQPMMGSPYGQPGMMMGQQQQQQPMMGSPYGQPGMMMNQQQPMMGSPYGQPGMMMGQQQQQQPMMTTPYAQPVMMNQQQPAMMVQGQPFTMGIQP